MSHSYLTTAEVAYFNKVDMDLVVSEILNASPLLQVLAARTCRGNSFSYTRATAAPSVGFREANDGIETTKTTREKVSLDLAILDGSFAVDVAVAQADERGWQHTMAEEAMAHLRQALFEAEQQIINGTSNLADGFEGFRDGASWDETGDEQVIDAGGTTESQASSVYILCSGPGDVEALWGQEGVIDIGEMQVVERSGSSTGTFPAYYHPIVAFSGVKIGSKYSLTRIINITNDTGCKLDDDLISDALAAFPVGKDPNYIVMNRRSRKQLQQSRTATNATGAPAPIPMDAFGVPIVTTDAISSTESLVS